MGARFLDHEARSGFKRAVEAIETASAVEVVVAVRRRSATHRHVNVLVGAAVAFVGLATMLYASQTFQLSSILVDPFVVALLAGGAVELLPQVKRWLTPRTIRRRDVQLAAHATFVERGVHNTTRRSGVLVYISWQEQLIVLVPDSGLAHELPPDVIPRAEADLTAAMSRGGAEVARRLEALAPAMAAAMPHGDKTVNELPDAIDTDMGGE